MIKTNKKTMIIKGLCLTIFLTIGGINHVYAFTTHDYERMNKHGISQLDWETLLSNSKEWDRFNDSYESNDYNQRHEFLKTVDLAPIIDKYGTDVKYKIEYDAYAENSGNVLTYMQNGSTTKYQMDLPVVDFDNMGFQGKVSIFNDKYKHYSFITKFYRTNHQVNESFLSFYGKYGTGVIPHVKNIKVSVLQ